MSCYVISYYIIVYSIRYDTIRYDTIIGERLGPLETAGGAEGDAEVLF